MTVPGTILSIAAISAYENSYNVSKPDGLTEPLWQRIDRLLQVDIERIPQEDLFWRLDAICVSG